MEMNGMTGVVEIDGVKFKLQHPGAYNYFKKKMEFQGITSKGYIQVDTLKVFEYCFGQDGEGGKVVFPVEGTKVNWRDAGLKTHGLDKGVYIPTLKELGGVWALLLPSFLDGDFEESGEANSIKWSWLEKNGGNPNRDKEESPSTGSGTGDDIKPDVTISD